MVSLWPAWALIPLQLALLHTASTPVPQGAYGITLGAAAIAVFALQSLWALARRGTAGGTKKRTEDTGPGPVGALYQVWIVAVAVYGPLLMGPLRTMCILLFCLLVPKGLLLGRINSRRGQISLASALAILLMRELAYSSISPRFLLLTLPIFPCALLISILLLEHGGQERPSLANSLIGLAASAAFYLADLWLVGLVPHASLAALCIITVSLSVLMTQQLPLSLVEFEHEFSRTFFMIAISMFVTAKTMGLSVSGFDLCVVAVVYVGFISGLAANGKPRPGLRLYDNKYIREILADKNSRQIFYFLLLNLSFMFVQMAYGYVTNSLGLISDSIHMLFDCFALCVGLVASVMSKWPPNARFPFGFAKIETLSGFANAIFLILISFSIVGEAAHRIVHPQELCNTGQLLFVSTLGLGVNLFGMLAFNHAHVHHGHSHGSCGGTHPEEVQATLPCGHAETHHNHNHHGHAHGHDHDHNHHGHHDHDHHGHANHELGQHHEHHGHAAHGHVNANMQGIFLHVLADTMGSVGVIISTLLVKQFGWAGFDPLASIFIAVLIFLSVIPLVKVSAQELLLSMPPDQVYSLKSSLSDISVMQGVANMDTPKFWLDGRGDVQGILNVQVSIDSDLDATRRRIERRLLSENPRAAGVVIQTVRDPIMSQI